MSELPALAPREHELLALAARPMSAKEIALETGLSLGTVNNYLSNAQRRLGARNRTEAVRMFRAIENAGADKLHMKFFRVPDYTLAGPHLDPELMAPAPPVFPGLADSLAPRSRASLEAFLGDTDGRSLKLPSPGSLDWQKRLCAVLVLTVLLAFTMAAVVILLDALTRLTTTI
jgi:DNA-binding CsgD family transcriptional regulator